MLESTDYSLNFLSDVGEILNEDFEFPDMALIQALEETPTEKVYSSGVGLSTYHDDLDFEFFLESSSAMFQDNDHSSNVLLKPSPSHCLFSFNGSLVQTSDMTKKRMRGSKTTSEGPSSDESMEAILKRLDKCMDRSSQSRSLISQICPTFPSSCLSKNTSVADGEFSKSTSSCCRSSSPPPPSPKVVEEGISERRKKRCKATYDERDFSCCGVLLEKTCFSVSLLNGSVATRNVDAPAFRSRYDVEKATGQSSIVSSFLRRSKRNVAVL